MWFIVKETGALTPPPHCQFTEMILKEHRKSVTTYKQPDVSQEWQLRVRYNPSLSLLSAYQLRSLQCYHYPLIFRDLLVNLAKTKQIQIHTPLPYLKFCVFKYLVKTKIDLHHLSIHRIPQNWYQNTCKFKYVFMVLYGSFFTIVFTWFGKISSFAILLDFNPPFPPPHFRAILLRWHKRSKEKCMSKRMSNMSNVWNVWVIWKMYE